VEKYLANTDMALIKGVKRIQGFILQKGNPKNIKSFHDLTREDIQFVNRQRGAGTRILVDYKLKENKIDIEAISGYEREMTTHMAVAAAVASGAADVGVGVLSAAKALDLDFIPIGDEDYDFAVPKKYLNNDMIKLFIHVLKSEELKGSLEALGGYKLDHRGEIVLIG
jgi:putative molybdopterin biosynthesis protein